MAPDLSQARQDFLASGDDRLLPIVDAHHHFWAVPANPHPWLVERPRIPFRYGDYDSICRDFLPPDYASACGGHRVLRHVVMEGEWTPADPAGEAEWMLGLARATGKPHAMAAQIWLDRDDAPALVARYASAPLNILVRSVRHKPRHVPREQHHATFAEPGSMRCERWRRGYALLQGSGLMFELQTPWWHMGEALELARDFPGVQIVVNHAGLPAQRDEGSLRAWRQAMAALADAPNVAVKLSGLGVPGQAWNAALQAPVIDALIEDFGASRCLFASNFPVDGLTTSLPALWDCFKRVTAKRAPAERLALFCDNAAALYGLH